VTKQETRVVTDVDVSAARRMLLAGGSFEEREAPQHSLWQLRDKIEGVVTAYTSGKVVIQGADSAWVEGVSQKLQRNITGSNGEDRELEIKPHIGVDEAGKGDYFGPLVVGAVYVETAAQAQSLRHMGVKDSKKLSDDAAIRLHKEIPALCPHITETVINPGEYNMRYEKIRNVNVLLAQGHALSIEKVLSDIPQGNCTQVVIDQFSKKESRVLDELLEKGKKLEVLQMHGGESDIAVAAASIIARGRFLLELQHMGKKYKTHFPKGASDVIPFAKKFYQEHGYEALKNVSKISFKTTLQVTAAFDL